MRPYEFSGSARCSENHMTALSSETTVSVIIPALNEAENLPFVLPRIPGWVDEVILVDDHCTDDTVEVGNPAVASAFRW